MRRFGRMAWGMVLMLGTVGCGGGTSSKSMTATGTSAPGPKMALEACPGTASGLYAIDPSGVLRWSRCDESGSYRLMTVALAGNLAYIVELGKGVPSLVARKVEDGTEVWRFAFSAPNGGFGYHAVEASDRASFAAGGIIVVDVQAGRGMDHVGLDAQNGKERWRVAADGGLVTLNTDELVVTSKGFGGELAGSGPSGPVAAYDRRSGQRRWLAEDVPYFGGSSGARLAGDTMVVQLFAGAAPSGVMGIDLATGKQRWRHDDRLRLASANADVVVGLTGDSPTAGQLLALDPVDGRELWRASASAFAAGANSEQTTATSVEPNSATLTWWAPLAIDGTVVAQTAAVTSGQVPALAGKVLVGFEARSGRERWRRETPLLNRSGGGGNVVLFETRSGLELVRAEDGASRWSAPFSAAMQVEAAVADDLTVLSLRPSEETPIPSSPGQPYENPATRSVGCAGGTPIAGGWIPSMGPGEPVHDLTVLISADGSRLCVINSSGAEDVVPFEPGRVVSKPEATVVQGTLADYLVVAVPAAWGQNPHVTVAGGQVLSSAMTRDGTVMLVIDYAPVGATPDQYVDRTFTFTGSEGQTLGEITVAAPPTGSIDDVLACLAQHGVHVAPQGRPQTVPLDKQPIDPTLAGAAWTACRPLVLLSFEASGTSPPQQTLDQFDCMASKGFFDMFTAGEIDARTQAIARSECNATRPLDPAGLRCDVYTIGTDGALSAEPVMTGLRFSMRAEATAPSNADVGAPVTVTIPAQETSLINATAGFAILDYRDIVRTFTITGATIIPGSLIQDPPPGPDAETTATATDATVTLGQMTPVAGGGLVRFPAARFDIVASEPGTVTIAFVGYDSTIRVRNSGGVETPVRALCTTDDRTLATITVS